jgi:hypothetical protein
MKTLMTMMFALIVSLSVIAWAQDQSSSQGQSSSSQGQSGQASQGSQTSSGSSSSGNSSMSGTVSKNGKQFTNDQNNQTYTVSNPDALQGHEGQHVAVLVHVDPDTNTIHITQIEAPPQQ